MRRRSGLSTYLVVILVGAGLAVAPGTASAAGTAHDVVVAATPDARTPQILDSSTSVTERVFAMAQVGSRIVVAGQFSQVRDVGANSGQTFPRTNVLAFDATTGAVDRGFAPVIDGGVNAVLAGADDTSVYLGGTFTQLNGASSRNLVQVSMTTGVRTAFRAPLLNGAVNDLALAGGRLVWAARSTWGERATPRPPRPRPRAGGVVSLWSDKQSAARSWTAPDTGVVERSNQAGIGTGDLATLLVDRGTAVPTGSVGGHTATVPAASNRATVFTLVLAPQS